MKIDNIKEKVWKRGDKFKVKIEFDVVIGDKHDKSYWDKAEVKCRVEQNSKWLVPQIVEWAGFDYCYSIRLFSESLIKLGERLQEYETYIGIVGPKYLKKTQKRARRAIFAGKMLEKIYTTNYICKDRHWKGKIRAARTVKVRNPTRNTTSWHFNTTDYDDKMFEVIRKRCDAQEKLDKEWIWAYIKKHIEYFWD